LNGHLNGNGNSGIGAGNGNGPILGPNGPTGNGGTPNMVTGNGPNMVTGRDVKMATNFITLVNKSRFLGKFRPKNWRNLVS